MVVVQAGDAGQYKAVARNASGESQATINLTFEDSGPGKPKIPDGIAPRSVLLIKRMLHKRS
jgi:hypothetical protein